MLIMSFCKNCGNKIEDRVKFCGSCGVKTDNYFNSLKRESPSISDAVKIACLSCGGSEFKETDGKKKCIFCGTQYITRADIEVNMAGQKAESIVKGISKGVFDVGVSIINKAENIKKSRSLALVLSLFLGSLGAHHFYLGYYKKGIISIIMSASLIGLIISFPSSIIDVFRISSGSYKPKNGEYE